MDYEVKYTREGRSGDVFYIEDGLKLPFEWDITTVGFDIYVPMPNEWDAFCENHGAYWAKGRRQEILQRIADEMRRQRAKGAKISIDDTGISFSLEGSLVYRLLSKILGV
jgi:hypothetical protein